MDESLLEQKGKRRKRKVKSHENMANSISKDMENNTADRQKRAYKKRKPNKYDSPDVKYRKSRKRRKRTSHRDNTEVDEVGRLERRAKYLLVKMKLEQNLIDAYTGEGWKGQSREKIKPDKELQRAKKQILKCKLGIREAVRQLDLLSSVGSMDKALVDEDGSVHHEHIVCAKCKVQEALPDNDIILCDGTCNCAYHQKCLDPPLLTENIPPGDQGWFCKYCVSRMEIIGTTNANLGTHFPADTQWQDMFKEEAALPDGEAVALNEQEWPSDDSEDDDYDPDKTENNDNLTMVAPDSESDSDDDDVNNSSSSSLWSLEDEVLSEPEPVMDSRNKDRNNCVDTNDVVVGGVLDDTADFEVLSGPRQRRAVDYRKLYGEMFGKDASVVEQNSEDEDWGPGKRKRKKKESLAAPATLMNISGPDNNQIDANELQVIKNEPEEIDGVATRHNFRIPGHAVEKLRLAFAENELPSRAKRENIAEELGIDYEKINKWFKNARYSALKARKVDKGDEGQSAKTEDLASAIVIDLTSVNDRERNTMQKQLIKSSKRKMPNKPALVTTKKAGDDTSLNDFANKTKNSTAMDDDDDDSEEEIEDPEQEADFRRVFELHDRIRKLHNILDKYDNKPKSRKKNVVDTRDSVMYVPVAELVEKM